MLCGSHIKIWNLANHMKKQNKKHQNARYIGEELKTKSLMFFVSFFFIWFARFQILICEPQSILRKLLVLSWLYLIGCSIFGEIAYTCMWQCTWLSTCTRKNTTMYFSNVFTIYISEAWLQNSTALHNPIITYFAPIILCSLIWSNIFFSLFSFQSRFDGMNISCREFETYQQRHLLTN